MREKRPTLREVTERLGFYVKDFDGDIDEMYYSMFCKLEALEMESNNLRERLRVAKQVLDGNF